MAQAEGGLDQDHHVHFDVNQSAQVNSQIVVKSESGNSIAVHLGFLQLNHVYDVTFSIKDNLSEELQCDPLQNLYVKVKQVMPSEDGEGHDVRLELHAHKEKLVKEEVKLVDARDPSRSLTLVLHARVLGKGKGTPSLKDGIKLIGMDADEDSDASDWQGFD